MLETVLAAVGVVLVIEGLMPLLSPSTWRQTMAKVLALGEGQLRFVGLVSVAVGAVLLIVSAL